MPTRCTAPTYRPTPRCTRSHSCKRAQQILAGRELARKQREQAWRLRGVVEDRTCDLQVSSSIEEGAGLRSAQQK